MSWQQSPHSPLTQNSVTLAKAGLTAFAKRDAVIGPFYTARWAELSAPQLAQTHAFLGNVSSWSWGHSDFDWCCDDGKAPSYLLYMVTQQGCPKDWNRKDGSWFQAMGRVNTSIVDWLRSYFPDGPTPPPPPSPPPNPPGPHRQWTTQDNFEYSAGERWTNESGAFPLLGVVHSAAACQSLCGAMVTCHAYTWNSPTSKTRGTPDSKCVGRNDGHYVPTAAPGFYSGHDPTATPLLPPGTGPRPVAPVPAFVPGACGAVKQPCVSDKDCPSGCGRRRRDCHSAAPPSTFSGCFNSDGEGASVK